MSGTLVLQLTFEGIVIRPTGQDKIVVTATQPQPGDSWQVTMQIAGQNSQGFTSPSNEENHTTLIMRKVTKRVNDIFTPDGDPIFCQIEGEWRTTHESLPVTES